MTKKAAPKTPTPPVRTPYDVDLLPLIGVEGAYHHNTKRAHVGREEVTVAVQPFLYRFGHAFAAVDLDVSSLTIMVYCRHEGDTADVYPTGTAYLGWRRVGCRTDAEAAAVIADALRTGRTVECGGGVSLREMTGFTRYQKSAVDMSWTALLESVNGRIYHGSMDKAAPWNLNPDYQRGPVWTREQQSRYIGHHLLGGQVGPLYVQRYENATNSPSEKYWQEAEEVIDGQQRLRAICSFLRNEVPATVFFDGGWRSFMFRDMNEGEQGGYDLMSSKVVFIDLPRAERLRFYLFLNSGGTPHTEADLKKVADLLKEAGGK